MHWLAGSLLLAAGCWHSGPEVKPPPRPEEYMVPPEQEVRWSNPVEYPKGTLFTDAIKRKDEPGFGPNGPSGAPGGFGGTGMGPGRGY
jgi:hypothetical protein